MLDCTHDQGPISEWLEYIENPGTRAAYLYILGIALTSTKYTCHAQWKGEARDFRFREASGVQPHSFITNQEWLLFYFRPPAIRSQVYSREAIENDFDSFEETTAGEWTVKLRSVVDVERLSKHVGWSAA